MAKARDIEQIISQIFTAGRLIRQDAERRRVFGRWSFLQLETIRFIAERKSPAMREIAEHFSITPPSATVLVNELVKLRQLKRSADKEDRRITRLSVTRNGERTIRETHEKKAMRLRTALSGLTDAERAHLLSAFTKITAVYGK